MVDAVTIAYENKAKNISNRISVQLNLFIFFTVEQSYGFHEPNHKLLTQLAAGRKEIKVSESTIVVIDSFHL